MIKNNETGTKQIPLFFIIGRARSGTTLLRTLFDAHPNVKIPIEAPVIMQMNKKYGKITEWTKGLLLEFYDDLLRVKDFNKWEIDEEKLKSELLKHEGQSNFKQLINTIYLNSPTIFRKEKIMLLGDKNPIYSISIKNLFKLYPEAKYIHLKRDHRAHIVSMQKAGLYATDIVALAFRWKYSANKLSNLKGKCPDSFFSLRYEDLVNAPEKHLQGICTFLNIPFCPEVINYHELTNELYNTKLENTIEEHHKRVFKPIDASRVDSWKNEMSKANIKIADYVVGRWTEKEGYERQFTKFPFSLKIKVFPAILYQRLFYAYRYIYHKLPAVFRK